VLLSFILASDWNHTVARIAKPLITTPAPRISLTHSLWRRFQCTKRLRVGRAEAAINIATNEHEDDVIYHQVAIAQNSGRLKSKQAQHSEVNSPTAENCAKAYQKNS
jgi:hypothetical protein